MTIEVSTVVQLSSRLTEVNRPIVLFATGSPYREAWTPVVIMGPSSHTTVRSEME